MLHHELTVIIPAFNEEKNIGDTIHSLQLQTTPPKDIIVVDDYSTDKTGDVARSYGVRVVRPAENTGSKAGAQNFALKGIETDLIMALDADTILEHDAIEKLLPAFRDEHVVSACGFVVPRYTRTLWERGRYIEYLIAFTFYKPIQEYYGKPLISSGCFSAYRTEILKKSGGWPRRTLAEDMDLTWTYYHSGYKIRFIPEAVCYPIEPYSFKFMKIQLRRWSHGFVQNLRLHGRNIVHIPYLNAIIAVMTWDSLVASCVFIFLLPLFTLITRNPFLLVGYVIDAPIILIPAFIQGFLRKEKLRVILSFPAFFILRLVNSFFILEAFWTEIILGRRLLLYQKGH